MIQVEGSTAAEPSSENRLKDVPEIGKCPEWLQRTGRSGWPEMRLDSWEARSPRALKAG